MSVVLLGTNECQSCRPVWSVVLGPTVGNLLVDIFEANLQTRGVGHPKFLGTNGQSTGTASFVGNFTAVTEPSGTYFALVRAADCSLGLVSGTSALDGTANVQGLIVHYERVLHQRAGLTTTADVYAGGCAGSNLGMTTRQAVVVGKTTSGDVVVAAVSNSSTNAVYVGILAPALTTGTFAPTGSLPYAGGLVTADLNGDQNGDLVVVNSQGAPSSPTVNVLLGNADGTFQSPVSYAIAGNQYSVAATIDDVNGDGKPDIIVVSDDQQISVLLGKGDGTFQPAMSFAAPVLPGYTSSASTPILNLTTADVNGDGKKDVICSNGLVLLGSGNGTFTATAAPAFPYTSANPGGYGPGLAAGDINKDGKQDIVVDTGILISTYLGDGSGRFSASASYASMNNSGYVKLTDLDGDGNLDIYSGLSNDGLYSGDDSVYNAAYVLMGRGDGTFAGAPNAVSGAYSGNNLGDVNGDGVPDLITSDSGPSAVFTVQTGTGNGTFTVVSTVSPPSSFSLSGYIFTNAPASAVSVVADINGDKKADLVFVDSNLTTKNPGGMLISYPYPVYFTAISNGDGTFATPTPYAFPQIAASSGFDNTLTVTHLQLADVNKDGKADLIFSYNETAGGAGVQPYNQGIGVLLGNGDGTFSATPILTSSYSGATAPNPSFYPYVTGIADINNDGKADLVVLAPSFSVGSGISIPVQVYLGNGDGTFQAPKTLTLSANVYGTPVIADFNKDGKLDVALLAETASSQAELVMAQGNGDGTFATPVISNLVGGDAIRSSAIASADFDGDGQPDIALFENSGFSGVFYGKGDGTFTSVPGTGYVVPKDLLAISATNGGAATAVDLNKDGKADILAGSTVLLNVYGAEPSSLSPTSIAVTGPTGTVSAGSNVTLTATVTPNTGSPAPGGTVTFKNGAVVLGTGTVGAATAGVATYSTATLPTGSDSITAVYGGDANFSSSASPALSVMVTGSAAVGTSTALSASAGTAVSGTSITFTATVTPASGSTIPSGTVSFLDGGTQIGTGALNGSGVATYSTSTLAAGSHTISAAYGGASGSFNSSTSSSVTVTITAPATPDFTVAVSPTSSTVIHGTSAITTVTVGSVGGFNSAVALSCAGAPTNTTCSVATTPVTPSGSASPTSTITLQTSIQSASLRMPDPGGWIALATIFPAGLFGVALLRRRGVSLLSQLCVVVVAGMLLASASCGGKASSSTGPTTVYPSPGTYNITVTGNSGGTGHSATWVVTIQ
ncbi:MAG TPA: FG-GAP-like repeat-containing protein [Acidobacteriaceae bacterium]|nr:FG-GAP-like repeat-containing protein [Acidobacteriaceae bacterium]